MLIYCNFIAEEIIFIFAFTDNPYFVIDMKIFFKCAERVKAESAERTFFKPGALYLLSLFIF